MLAAGRFPCFYEPVFQQAGSFPVRYAGASCQKAVSCRQLREMGLKSLPYQLGHYM